MGAKKFCENMVAWCACLLFSACLGWLGSAQADTGLSSAVADNSRQAEMDSLKAVEQIRPMALSEDRGVAVVSVAKQKQLVVHIGERIEGTRLILKAVLPDRVVVSPFEGGQAPKTYWVYKPASAAEVPKVLEISGRPRPEDVKTPPATKLIRIPLPSQKTDTEGSSRSSSLSSKNQ